MATKAGEPTALELNIADAEAMQALGAALAADCRAGQSMHLQGELGAGKTTLARGILHALGHLDRVPSPSYALVESYRLSRFPVHHLDFYRLGETVSELESLGIRDYFDGSALCLVEWPERAATLLPPPHWQIQLAWAGAGEIRRVKLRVVPTGAQETWLFLKNLLK